eukprot:GFYU01000082.1.p1 GENE.GFYU01000082.1~~GFYU01000082.1.p1  ORF type:complete len:575 (+),score=116.64 GFYU01000082.1:141-1865(+)
MLMWFHTGSSNAAWDVNNFRVLAQSGSQPTVTSISHDGIISENYFATGKEDKRLFAMNYCIGKSKDPISQQPEHYLAIGLNSRLDGDGLKTAGRPALRLMISLDISGSMSSPFSMEDSQSKLEAAKDSLLRMLKHLRPQDSFGLVAFDTECVVVQPLMQWSEINVNKLESGIRGLHPRGGTYMEIAMTHCVESLRQLKVAGENAASKDEDYRIMFFTDMMPNAGVCDGEGLFSMIQQQAVEGIPTTMFGVGLDFNTSMVEAIIQNPGCNYMSILSPSDFADTLDRDFEYLVHPIVFNVSLNIECKDFDIVRIYGSPGYEIPTEGKCLQMMTVFPSAKRNNVQTKGGVVLALLKPRTESLADTTCEMTLKLQYEDRRKRLCTSEEKVSLRVPSETDALAANDSDGDQDWLLVPRTAADCSDFTEEENVERVTQLSSVELVLADLDSPPSASATVSSVAEKDQTMVHALNKAVTLIRYVNVVRHWLDDTEHGKLPSVNTKSGIPPHQLIGIAGTDQPHRVHTRPMEITEHYATTLQTIKDNVASLHREQGSTSTELTTVMEDIDHILNTAARASAK